MILSAANFLYTHVTVHQFVISVFLFRFKAGGSRGVDVPAGPAGPLPEDAGDRPGVCSGQEGGAGPVSCPSSALRHTTLFSPSNNFSSIDLDQFGVFLKGNN